jgi:hypothetical protein
MPLVQTLNEKIGMQINIVEYCKPTFNEENSKFEMIHKEAANAHNNLNALEEQVIICR